MMISTRRFGWAGFFAGLALFWCCTSLAQEKTPFPTLSDKHVYVSGVPDHYKALEAQINQLERSSPQTYYVVVVKNVGPGARAAVQYAEELFDRWSSEAARSRRSFNADKSILIVLAVDNQKIAVRPGAVLQSQFGLTAAKIERDLIRGEFIGFAEKGQYQEGLAALLAGLLNETNDAIAAHDGLTARAPVKITASRSPKIPAQAGKADGTRNAPASSGRTTSPKASEKGPEILVAQRETSRQATAGGAPAQPVRTSSDWMSGLAVVIPIVGAVLLLIAGALWWGYRRSRSRVGSRIKEVRSKAVDVMDHLDALKERLKLLPTSPEFRAPMAGETLALYQSAKQSSDKLWDGWLLIMEVLDKAQKLAEKSGSMFSQATLTEAENLIKEKGSFEQIENQAQEIAKTVDRLDRAQPAARAVLEAINAAGPKLSAGLEALTKLDLPTKPYQGELDARSAEVARAGAEMAADPLGMQKALEELRTRSEGLLGRIERVASLCADARGVKVTLEAMRKQVAAHRAQGLKLVESGGNPDGALSEGETGQAEVLAALREGDADGGAQKLSAAQARIREAQATIEQVQKARAFCDRDPAARLRETERLRAAITQAEAYQADLERDFAASSWSGVARNLDQAQALLATFDRQVQDSAAMASSSRQEYLKAARMLEELARQQQILLRLMSGLGEQLNSLVAVRNESRSAIEQLAARERDAELLIRQNEAVVGDLARESLVKAQQLRQEILLRSARPRPDWPALRQSLAEAIENMSIAQSQAEEDVKNFELLNSEFEGARRTAGRVYALLSSHREDRPAANQHYQAAADALDRIAMSMQEPRGIAASLLAQVRDAAGDLERSEQLAREDIRLAAQAQSEIAEGAQAIRQAQGYGGMGISSDTSSAQSQLMQAEQLLESQNYEQSIQHAGAATQLARQVYYAAMQQAMLQQAAAMAEQRRLAARAAAPAWDGISFGTAAATTAAATILENASASPYSPAPEPEPATAGGSWGGETAEGSW
jgi:TPM domain